MLFPQGATPTKSYTRFISLVPSLTELLYDLGLEEEVVGITKFCIHPTEWFRSKTRIGGTKEVNFEKINEVAPQLIIANKEENTKEQIEKLAEKYDVLLTDVNNLDEALAMIKSIGLFANKLPEAIIMSDKIKTKFDDLKKKVLNKKQTRAVYFIWKNPYMVAANETFIHEMMEYCGFQNVFSNESRYPEIDLAQLTTLDCELILLSSEPYPFKEKHKEEISKELPGMQIKLVDGEMFSWYGSRLLKAADYFEALSG
jgi:ABC-type Fe3+-hydroxamate transport system substrate-binding protein